MNRTLRLALLMAILACERDRPVEMIRPQAPTVCPEATERACCVLCEGRCICAHEVESACGSCAAGEETKG